MAWMDESNCAGLRSVAWNNQPKRRQYLVTFTERVKVYADSPENAQRAAETYSSLGASELDIDVEPLED